ncbi:protein-glutamine gamma-glutamyltransferase E-like [Spea bombifrons]|uniref:protein-glutamine gamma-glutamyltransferase E-like n=1 Tax=Spea bombifrons TaxID=233779 RepID=UPI00234B74DF|nr:protein-glutamine gamma-glutamyltransferase E-like [Spea bombifrons]
MSEVTPVSQVCIPLSSETNISGAFKLVGTRAVGKDVNLILLITNPANDSKDITTKIRAYSILYTKKEMYEILNECRKDHLKCNEVKGIPIRITYTQYEDRLTADNMIEVTAACSCEQTNETVIVQTSIVLDNPTFEIKVKGKAYVNKPVTAEVVFKNPLNAELTDIVVTAEGSGLIKDPITAKANCAKPKETITIPITITPYKSGTRHLLVDLTCNKFMNVKGYTEVEVLEAE